MIEPILKTELYDYETLSIGSYWFYGDLLYFLMKSFDGANYLVNNFLNIYSYGMDTFSLYFDIEYQNKRSHIKLLTKCPFIECQIINRPFEMTSDYIKQVIDDGWCILAKIDKSFINSCPITGNFLHEIMIYEYEAKSDRLMFSDNNRIGKYDSNLSCTFSEFQDGFLAVDQLDVDKSVFWKDYFYLLRPLNPNVDIDIEKVIRSLKQYLNILPYEDLNNNELRQVYDDLHIFIGLKVYGHLKEFLKEFNKNNSNRHMGGVSVLCEHKTILLFAVKYLCNKYNLSKSYIKKFEFIKQEVFLLRTQILKYYVNTQNERYLDVIVSHIRKIRRYEKKCLLRFVQDLEGKIN